MLRAFRFIITGLAIHGATVAAPVAYELTVNIGGNVASATLTGEAISPTQFHVTGGALEVVAGGLAAAGSYSLIQGGPSPTSYKGVSFDNVLNPDNASVFSASGLLFGSSSMLIKLFSDEDPYTIGVFDGNGQLLGGASDVYDSVSLTAIPEPGSIMLAVLAFAVMAGVRLRTS